jgi:hypothetical protein
MMRTAAWLGAKCAYRTVVVIVHHSKVSVFAGSSSEERKIVGVIDRRLTEKVEGAHLCTTPDICGDDVFHYWQYPINPGNKSFTSKLSTSTGQKQATYELST